MRSFSGLGLGLSLVFGCLLLAFVAELYYLLWWKKKRIVTNREIEEEYGNFAKELFHFICWKRNTPNNNNSQQLSQERKVDPDSNQNDQYEQDLELGCSAKDHVLLKPIGEEGVESELMRLHNLAGPPRFLFTINEETKEDLESEDGKSRRGSRTRSLSDLLVAVDTPFLTPLASPRLKSSPLESYKHHGFNPLFESETELSRLRSSPPPKFKFLRDAEEKLYRRLLEEAQKNAASQNHPVSLSGAAEDRDGSFFKFMVAKNDNNINNSNNQPQCPSSSSQVLPLASSPTSLRPDQLDSNKSVLN